MSAHLEQVCDMGPVRGTIVTSIALSFRNIQGYQFTVSMSVNFALRDAKKRAGKSRSARSAVFAGNLAIFAKAAARHPLRPFNPMSLPELPTSHRLVLECNHNAFQVLIIKNFVTRFKFLKNFCTQYVVRSMSRRLFLSF